MKKSVLLLGTVLLILSGLTGCAGTEKGPKAVKSAHNDTSIKAVNALAVQLGNNRPDAAWYRMNEEYRIGISEKQFTEIWKQASENLGEIKGKQDAILISDGVYQVITVPFDFEKGTLYGIFTVFAEAINPLDVKFGTEIPEVKTQGSNPDAVLKDLCKDYFKIGCGITGASPANSAVRSHEFMETAAEHFSSWTSTNLMKPSYLLQQNPSMKNAAKGDETPVLDFSACDPVLKYAMEKGIQVRGHTLVWHTQIPDWFFLEGYKTGASVVDKETMKFRMESYIKQYITHCQEKYPGVVYCWDVVNEAVDPAGDKSVNWSCRKVNDKYDNMWYKALGTDYVELAFEYARKYADPDVKLYYNDYGTFDRTKRQYIYNLLCSLKEKNLIDGVGMQGYWDFNNPSLQVLKDTIELYASTGLEIQITELSISSPDETENNLILQAERHASIFRLLQKLDTQGGGTANITAVTFFGLMNNFMFSPGDKTNCRPFDKNLEPNRIYFAVKDTFDMFY